VNGVLWCRDGLGTEKVFETDIVTVPFQLTLPRPPQEDPRFVAVDAAAPLEQHFPVGQKVLYLEAPFNGVPATVKCVVFLFFAFNFRNFSFLSFSFIRLRYTD
jgi:hypothetical protein